MSTKPTIEVEGETAPARPGHRAPPDPKRVEYGVDKRGRRIGVKRVSMIVRRTAFNAASVENSQKFGYINPAITACACVSIDNHPVNPPMNELQLNALMDQLDFDGLACIAEVLNQHFNETDEEVIKNS